MTMSPEQHHPDCDYRNSHAAVECDERHGVPEGETPNELHDCNLGCEQEMTPGPWYWSNKGGVLILYRQGERGVILRTQPQAGNDYDLTDADARAITAVHDLLAAARHAYNVLATFHHEDPTNEVMIELHEAITKATGAAPERRDPVCPTCRDTGLVPCDHVPCDGSCATTGGQVCPACNGDAEHAAENAQQAKRRAMMTVILARHGRPHDPANLPDFDPQYEDDPEDLDRYVGIERCEHSGSWYHFDNNLTNTVNALGEWTPVAVIDLDTGDEWDVTTVAKQGDLTMAKWANVMAGS